MDYPAVKSSTGQLLATELYDATYGIYNHSAPDSDKYYAGMQMHWAEDCTSTSEKHRAIEKFIELQVHLKTGLSLDDFFKLTRDDCRKIMEMCEKIAIRDANAATDLINGLKTNK